MCIIDQFNKGILIRIDLILIFIVSVSQLVFGILRDRADFNTNVFLMHLHFLIFI